MVMGAGALCLICTQGSSPPFNVETPTNVETPSSVETPSKETPLKHCGAHMLMSALSPERLTDSQLQHLKII